MGNKIFALVTKQHFPSVVNNPDSMLSWIVWLRTEKKVDGKFFLLFQKFFN